MSNVDAELVTETVFEDEAAIEYAEIEGIELNVALSLYDRVETLEIDVAAL